MATGSMAAGARGARRRMTMAARFANLAPASARRVAGDGVGLVSGAEHDGKQAREIGRRCRVGLLHKFVDGGELPGVEDHRGERGFEALIVGAQDSGDGAAADPVAGAFVGDGEPPASGARGVTSSVAAVNDGAGAGDRDHSGARAESGFEGDLGVADNFDVGRAISGTSSARMLRIFAAISGRAAPAAPIQTARI